jgi:light-regulated signal transduction histidine kinase (bacteriophytochrome)
MTSAVLVKARRRLAVVCSVPLAISLVLFAVTVIAGGVRPWTMGFFSAGLAVMIAVLVWLFFEVLSCDEAREIAQTELHKMNAELEARVDARTRDLTRANEELQQFTHVASHDLQEPLRTITSFSQLLSSRYSGRLDEDADEFIGYIVSSSRRVTDLINGLLALARIRKAGQPADLVSFDDMLADAEISLQTLVRESGAKITSGALPSLVVDRVQLTQVLQNLISNAIKFRGEEAPSVHLEAKRDSGTWVFSVADNGRGFDPEFGERIFGLFQRLHQREADGTGLGLSVCRKIIERHGGRIWATSAPGSGSTFFFSLPTSLEMTNPTSSTQSPKAKAVAATSNLRA